MSKDDAVRELLEEIVSSKIDAVLKESIKKGITAGLNKEARKRRRKIVDNLAKYQDVRFPGMTEEQSKEQYILSRGQKNLRKYRIFYGPDIAQMPCLINGEDLETNPIDAPRIPLSISDVYFNRIYYESIWKANSITTMDCSVAGKEGDHLIVRKSEDYLGIHLESDVYNNEALVLSPDKWEELKADEENVLYLTAEEVKEVEGQGYLRFGSPGKYKYSPENSIVEKVLKFLFNENRFKDRALKEGKLEYMSQTDFLNLFFKECEKDEEEYGYKLHFGKAFMIFLNNTVTPMGEPTLKPFNFASRRACYLITAAGSIVCQNDGLVGESLERE